MKVRIIRLLRERKSATDCRAWDTFCIAQVKEHWWTSWEYIHEDNDKDDSVRVFDDADEVKDYIRNKYLDKLCKLK